MKKQTVQPLAAALLATALLAGCTSAGAQGPGSSGFNAAGPITVVSREDGSGTRGAFIELFGVEEAGADGVKVDKTTLEAVTISSTAVMMTTVAGDPHAIGYVSLGSLNDTVKALDIDGAAATTENILSGSYKIARPFNIATKADLSPVAADFVAFILSVEGQQVVEDNGYIPLEGAAPYAGTRPSGKVAVSGSSSVTPVMEKLAEAYKALNPDATIEIQQSDSSTGMSDAAEGISDIGMASRELKDSELEKGLAPTVIAMDGIAVIVNKANPAAALTSEQVKSIFTGEALTWEGFA